MSEPKKIVPKPADIRGISDPPDMGKVRPAWKAAEEHLRCGRLGQLLSVDSAACLAEAEETLADVIRKARAEGAAAALEEAADAFEMPADENEEVAGVEATDGYHDRAKSLATKAEAYRNVAALLRARIRTISDPPDMG